MWSRKHIANNVLAGLVVGIVALPLAMAFAIASGPRPEQGLYTAIVACLLTPLFGGTRLQISGPTSAFIPVLVINRSLTVFVDLVVAVNVGVVLAASFFMRRMSLEVIGEAQVENNADNRLSDGPMPARAVVYSIKGPLFLRPAAKLERTFAHIQRPATTLILRMSHVPLVGATGISAVEEIITDFIKHGATVLLSAVRQNVLRKLECVRAIDTERETWILIGKSCKSTAH
jgi:MFS superfamily sulfate permease-like transporter